MFSIRQCHARVFASLSLIVAVIALAPAAAHAASSVRIVRPANGELVNGRRMLVVVRVPSGASRVRVSVDGRNVSRRFYARGGTRVGTVTGVEPGAVHIVVSAGVRSQQLLAFANVFAQGRRDRRLIVLLNANATLLRHAANQGVARLAIRTPSNAILRATLNGHGVRVPVDFRTGNRLAVFNRADGLRRGRNTLRLVAFTRGGRYDRLTRSATIPRSAPMAVAGPDRQIVAGQTLQLNGGRSVAAQPGGGLSYSWRVVGKPAGTSPRLRSAARARAKLRLGKPGRYTLALTVTEQGPNGIRRRSTDLLLATVAPPAPPTGAPIETMAQQNGQTGILIATSKPQFSAGPPDGQVGVYGFDPKTLQTDPDRNVLIPDNGDVDSKLKDAVGQFTAGTIVVVTGRDCCGASSKLLPKSGAFSYITSYDGNKDHFGQSGTWNRNLKLTEDNGGTSAAGELNGVLRYQPSDDGTFRYVQDGSVSYSTSAPTESTLYPADGATYRILDSAGDAVDNKGAGGAGSQLSASRPASALGQQWELQRAYGDYYRIVNSASGMCMNLSGNDAKTVLQWPCTGANAANEVWFVRARSDGDEQYFTLEPASQPPGAKTVVASLGAGGMTVAPLDDGDKTQRFTFGLAPGVYTISDASTGNLVGEPDFDAAWGTRLAVGPASGHSTQQWRVVDGPSGSFKLVNVASGLCMDVTGASADAGTPIERYACDPNAENQPNELWSAVGQADGIALVSKNSAMVLSRQQGGLIQRDRQQRQGSAVALEPRLRAGDDGRRLRDRGNLGDRLGRAARAGRDRCRPGADVAQRRWDTAVAADGRRQRLGRALQPRHGQVPDAWLGRGRVALTVRPIQHRHLARRPPDRWDLCAH